MQWSLLLDVAMSKKKSFFPQLSRLPLKGAGAAFLASAGEGAKGVSGEGGDEGGADG